MDVCTRYMVVGRILKRIKCLSPVVHARDITGMQLYINNKNTLVL